MAVTRVPVWEGTIDETRDGGTLLATKCTSCGQVFFPSSKLCFNCIESNLEEITLSQRGILYSFATGCMASTHFSPPYVLGLVDMPEGVRILCPIKEVDNKPLEVGMEVELVIEKLWEEEDKEVIGYRFAPVTKND